MSRVLVDTSVWIEMLQRGETPAAAALGGLLDKGLACTHGLIRAEILSGARSDRDYRALRLGLSALPDAPDPPQPWERVALARYRLARQGFQASLADLLVAATASYHGLAVFTLDAAFSRIRSVMPLELFRIPRP